ncbi:hypothetical protein [Dysgonomonas sp. ZJ279]|uniref:hypothetical protein n=1 Tax=Dysgonomonas sp. ZJ279 TaxID=2709796 RepID=UPI0013EA29CA|nr:hypothetical protein [Dysgonomonas sp. ZJ279]
MDFFRAKLVTIILAFGLIVGGLIGALLYFQLPDYYPNWFEGILLFFLVLESSVVAYVEAQSRKATQRQLLNTYMLTKIVKIFASIIFVGIYALVIKEGIKNFILIFMLFYLLYLFVETLIFTRIEKRLKEKKQ